MAHHHDTPRDVARLRLVCLVRSGDGYLLRGSGVDISFGDAADRRTAAHLATAVHHIQRWCDTGATVSLLDTARGVALRDEDGTVVELPAGAA